jgi:methionyl-tRNA synthetase
MPKKFYITTPIYYPNAEPHIGSVYTTLLADVISRFQKLQGNDVFFLTGTDEHGQKIQEAALNKNITPKALVDSIASIFEDTFKHYKLDYSLFMRTTNEDHIKGVQEWIRILIKKGFIYKATYEGWYLTSSESFIAEKDIEERNAEGIPLCPISKKPAQWLQEDAYFFKLSLFEEKLLQFYDNNKDWIIPKERTNEIIEFVKGGLKDLCISRNKKQLSWGIPWPEDDNFVVYVWADALNNYITGIGYPFNMDLLNTIWPADVQLIGKDIFRFHAIYWPAFLMALELPLPKHLLTHGWIMVDNQKMSKSLGNVINPLELINKYGLDRVRYYLTRYMVITQDSSFSYADLEEKTTADLQNTFGNLVQRIVTLALKNGMNVVKPIDHYIIHETNEIKKQSDYMVAQFKMYMEKYEFHMAFQSIMTFLYKVNGYVNMQEPWKKSKTDPEEFKEIITICIHSIMNAAVFLSTVIPSTYKDLLSFVVGTNVELENIINWNVQYILKEPHILFPTLEKPKEEIIDQHIKKEIPVMESNMISIDELMKIEIRVGKIINVEDIAKSDKLYKLTVDFGNYGTRTICSGIKMDFSKEELLNKMCPFAYNLAQRKLMGIESCGMIMMAQNPQGKPTIVMIDPSVEPGTQLK